MQKEKDDLTAEIWSKAGGILRKRKRERWQIGGS